jgi:hypothetical protein
MIFVDQTRAVVQFYGQAFLWNPSETALGPEIPGGLDFGTYDGKGNVLGTRGAFDGGVPSGVEIVSLPLGDGGALDAAAIQSIGLNPFTNNGGFTSGAELWPHP